MQQEGTLGVQVCIAPSGAGRRTAGTERRDHLAQR